MSRLARFLSSISIQQRLLALAVTPVLLTTIILGYYITTSRLADAQNALQERGKAVTRHLSHALEFALFTGNKSMMTSTANASFEDSEILAINILGKNNELLLRAENPTIKRTEPEELSDDPILRFKRPIIETPIEIGDIVDSGGSETNDESNKRIMGWVEVELTTAQARSYQNTILTNSLLIIVSGFIISGIFAIRIGGVVATPIVHLTRAVQRISTGDYRAQVETSYGGELSTLADGFNKMALTIAKSQANLQQQVDHATLELRKIVHTLEEKNRELEHARRDALSASHAKTEFLAKMSHEIRTPLNAILGFSKLIERNAVSTDTLEYTTIINRAGTQLLFIIDDILNFSKLETGQVVLENIGFDLRNMIEDAVMMLRPAANQKQLDLIFNIHSDVPNRLLGDPTRINQIVANFINNAVKFTEAGSVCVQVSLENETEQAATLKISVIDTGIGIDKEQQNRLFRSFSQVDSTITRRFGGTGLGLAISKRLAELMGGEIGIESEKGKGATFWIKLTLPKQSEDTNKKEELSLAELNVTLIESQPLARRMIRNMFVHWHAQVIQLNDVRQLATSTPSHNCDILVLGLSARDFRSQYRRQVLSEIRANYAGPILVLAAVEDPTPDGGENVPGVTYYSKPLKAKRLFELVSQSISGIERDVVPVEKPIGARTGLRGRILLAEDNEFNRLVVKKYLASYPVIIDEAVNGIEAVQKYAGQDYDLVLMDVHMPEMDGIEAARQIRNMESPPQRLPIIALSADVFLSENDRIKSYGFDDFIAKPVAEDQLIERLKKWLKTSIVSESAIKPSMTTADAIIGKSAFDASMKKKLVGEIEKNRGDMLAAIAIGDLPKLREIVHQFNGMVGYFGVDALLVRGREIERQFHQGATIETLREQIQLLISAIAEYLASAPNE